MRKIIVLSFITIDGVMQAPGAPEEDTSGGFKFGGWTAPYDDDSSEELMKRLLKPADLLLGRKTFDIWEKFWPEHADQWPGVNEVTKYVLSSSRTTSDWSNVFFMKEFDAVKKLKNADGDEIKVWGSSELIQLLMQNDLVDEFWLMIHPITLGDGKKLFSGGSIPAAFTLAESLVTKSGVIIANYKRAGDVKTGRVGG